MSTAEIEETSNPPQATVKVGAWKPSGKRRKLQTMEEFEATHQGPPPQLGLAPQPSVPTSSTTSHAVTGAPGGGRGGEPSSSSRAIAAGAATLFDSPVAATPTIVQNTNTNPAGTVVGASFPRPMSLRDLSALNSSSDVDDGGAAARRTLNNFPRINSMETVYGLSGGTNGTTNQNYAVPMSPAASTTTSKFNVHSTSRMRGNTTFLNESSTSQQAPPPPASPVLQDLHQLEREWNFNKSSRGEGFSRVTSTTSLCDESSGSGGGLIGGEEEHSGGGGSTLQSPVKWSRDLEVITAATDTTPSGSFGFGSFAAGGNQSGGDEKGVQSKTGIRKNKKRSPLSRVMAPPPLQSPVFPRGVAGHLNVTRFPTTSSSSASGPSFPKTTSGTSYLMPRGGMPNSGVGSSGVSRGEGADCGMFPPTTFPAAGLRSPSENKERGGRGSSQFPLSNSEEGLRHSAGFPAAVNEGHHHQEESSTLLSPANVTDHHRPSSSPHHLAQHTLHHLHVDPFLIGGNNNHNNNNNNTCSIGPTDSQTNQMTTPSKLGTNVGESGGGTKEAQFPPTSSADGELLGGLKGGGDPADNVSTSTATAPSSIAANRAFGGGHSSTHTGFSTSTATAWKPRFMRNTAATTAPATKDNTACSEVSSSRIATPPCEGTTKIGTEVVEGKNKPPPWSAHSTTEKPPSTSSESKGAWPPRSAASRSSQPPPPPKLNEDYDDDEVDESAVCLAEEQEDGTTATDVTDSFAIRTTYAGGSTITQVNPLTSPNYVTDGGGGGTKTTTTTTAGRGGGQQRPATHYRGGAPSSIFMESEYEPDWSQFGTGALGAPASTIFLDGLVVGGAEEGGAATQMVPDESMKVNLAAGSMNPALAASGINSTPGGSPHGYRVGELGQYVQRKMKNGEAKLKLTDDGEGGTYFVVPVLGGGGVQSSSRTPTLGMANTPSAGSGGVSGGGGKAVGGEIIAVFKPKDEEIGCEGNPRGNTTLDLEERQGFDPGEGYIREQLAWELDYDHFAGVPETTIVSLSTKDELPSSSSAHATPSTTGGVGVTTPVSSSTTVQTGSLQRFIPSCQQSWDFGPAKFSTKVVHAIGIFDIRMLNSDRHGGNLLVPKGDKSMLVPIDHGYILPSGYSDPENLEWMDWEQSKKPFSDFELEYIAKLDREKDRNIVANRLNQDAGDTIATTTTLLQVAAPRGYNLREIAEFCRRPHLTKPSRLELLMAASRDMATLGLEMEKIDTNIKAAFPDKLDTAGKMFVNTGMSSVVNSQASDATTNPTPNAPLLIATTTTTSSSSNNKGGNQFFGIDDDSSDDDDD